MTPDSARRASRTGCTTPDSKPDIFTAVQQLGLELVPAETLLDTIVVDYLERPIGN
jgi:uncharacterized protein (TIGR03435 family)